MNLSIVLTLAASILPLSVNASPAEPLLEKATSSIVYDGTSGHLYASNAKTIYLSRDGGANWDEVVKGQEKGRHYNATGWDVAPEGGKLALFGIAEKQWITLDDGETWRVFHRPPESSKGGGRKHDGFTYGTVDWNNPQRMIGKEHHATRLWLTEDGGETWTELPGVNGFFGVEIAQDGSILIGRLDDAYGPPLPAGPNGIYRSTNDGETWKLVFPSRPMHKVGPKSRGDLIYWPLEEGIAVTSDSGKSWEMLEHSPPKVMRGPYFGTTPERMLVANAAGLHRSTDGGLSWKQVLNTDELHPHVKDQKQLLMRNFAWDDHNDELYMTSVYMPLYKMPLPDAGCPTCP